MTWIEVRAEEDGVSVAVEGRLSVPEFGRSVLDAAGALLTWPDIAGQGADATGVPPGTALSDAREGAAASRAAASGAAPFGGPRADLLPDALVESAPEAQTWLWAVYGAGAARAVAACASGRAHALRVAAEPGALARDLHRLATGHWASRWWPASHLDGVPALDADLLGLELAALSHRCQQVWDPDADPAADLVLEHRAGLRPLLDLWHARPGAVSDVLRSVRAAADDAGLDVDGLAGPIDPGGRDGSGPAGWATSTGDAVPRRPGALPQDHALAAGGAAGPPPGARVMGRGTGTNDWCRYPPGFVDASEDAVTWTAFAHGSRRAVLVEAVAGEARPALGVRPVAEVRVGATAPVRVRCERAGDAWTALVDTALPDTAAPSPDVQVVLPGFDPGPQDPGRARRTREGLRALARRRLAAAGGATGTDGAGAGEGFGPAPFLAEIVAAHTEEDF
ncbi:hypothetical protein [Nocardiopsis tropica]|uniref:hypothetical protein n=1 Tax=Nocardiopsis tropica TaxID=109330 RepID=UPI0031E24CB3